MPYGQLIAIAITGIFAMVAQLESDVIGLAERLGAFAITFVLAVAIIVYQRRDAHAREELLRQDLVEERKERQALDSIVLQQVVPLVTKATEVQRQMSQQIVENQNVIREQQRLLDRLIAKVDGLTHG